ncbi:MAG: CDP-glycerol glycerophosphotransferase family protein [Clostridiaceae bacterium]|nr:CDP-glycerol glycerophosphotransferase family protein [Clostridiaceae bacterium]
MRKLIINGIKYYLYNLIRSIFGLFFFARIKPNRILFMSYTGKQYSCNPRAITEKLLSGDSGYELIWVMDDNSITVPCRCVRSRTLKFYWYHLTSKYIITNGVVFKEVPIRKSQLLINTWHGGGAYKRVVYDNPSIKRDRYERKLMKNPDEQRTVYLSSCSMASQYVIKSGLGHHGAILEIGSPRNDKIIKKDNLYQVKELVYKYYKIDSTVKLLLYAPTFRDSLNTDLYNLDFNRICNALSKRFGGQWVVMVRMHQLISAKTEQENVINASMYPDMQDLLIAADAFITDYSSSIWDYSFTYKPGFLYAPDLSQYMGERNFYIDIADWPFIFAESVDDLCKNILSYNEIDADNRIRNHHKVMGSFETGTATEGLVAYWKEMENEE